MSTTTLAAVLGSLAAILGIVLLLWSSIAGNRENAQARAQARKDLGNQIGDVRDGVHRVERSVNERVDGVERSIRTEMRQGFDRLSEQIAGARNPSGEGSAASHDDGGESAAPAAAPAPVGDAPD